MKKIILSFLIAFGFHLCSTAQLLNGGFENWNQVTGLPDDWWGVILPPYDLLSQTTSAHSGNYAVKLKVDDFNGQAFASPLSTGNGGTTCHPLTFVPGSVSFWYELDPVAGDELSITALVYQAGTGVGVAITSVPVAQNYTYVNVPIMYGTVPPSADSIAVIFTLINVSGTANIGTEAKIDDVSVNVGSGLLNPEATQIQWNVTPNPVNDIAVIKFDNGNLPCSFLKIIDQNGKVVFSQNYLKSDLHNNEIKFNTSGFKNGLYYCVMEVNGVPVMKPFVVKH